MDYRDRSQAARQAARQPGSNLGRAPYCSTCVVLDTTPQGQGKGETPHHPQQQQQQRRKPAIAAAAATWFRSRCVLSSRSCCTAVPTISCHSLPFGLGNRVPGKMSPVDPDLHFQLLRARALPIGDRKKIPFASRCACLHSGDPPIRCTFFSHLRNGRCWLCSTPHPFRMSVHVSLSLAS